jgi:hypothetical protein
MGSWGDENFANDGARDYLSMLAAKLVATVTEIYRDEERLALDEDGEAMFMPSIELLALLCERYAATPPMPPLVKQWQERYLQVFDETVEGFNPDPEFQASRLNEVVSSRRGPIPTTPAPKRLSGKLVQRVISFGMQDRVAVHRLDPVEVQPVDAAHLEAVHLQCNALAVR